MKKGVRNERLRKWPRQESNLDLGFRRPTYYPLYYGADFTGLQRYEVFYARYTLFKVLPKRASGSNFVP